MNICVRNHNLKNEKKGIVINDEINFRESKG